MAHHRGRLKKSFDDADKADTPAAWLQSDLCRVLQASLGIPQSLAAAVSARQSRPSFAQVAERYAGWTGLFIANSAIFSAGEIATPCGGDRGDDVVTAR